MIATCIAVDDRVSIGDSEMGAVGDRRTKKAAGAATLEYR